jgi:hypothetical protein
MLTLAVRFADALNAGENTTFTVQLAAAPKLGGQLLVWEKSAAFAPVMLIPFMESGPPLPLSKVSACAGLGIPTLCGAKVRLAGEI